jgi:hypothetical protein
MEERVGEEVRPVEMAEDRHQTIANDHKFMITVGFQDQIKSTAGCVPHLEERPGSWIVAR